MMDCYIFFLLFLAFASETESSPDNGFFMSAPKVFHSGVKEKVYVQLGRTYRTTPVTVYLQHEVSGIVVSEKKDVSNTKDGNIEEVELMIDKDMLSRISQEYQVHYLLLVAESPSNWNERRITRVKFTKQRGYIFIQTHQPIYNPTKTVRYRVFTLDHKLRPSEEVFQLSIFNAAGNRVMHSLVTAKDGIYHGRFQIPDISKLGTWKITAHYESDTKHAATREFKVEKFVLPSFNVDIGLEQQYILLSAERFSFTISAKYSHGEKVRGAYHCQFGVVEKRKTGSSERKPTLIKGLELTGSVQDGTDETTASLLIADLDVQLKKQSLTLSDLQQRGLQLFLGVFVTNIQSGEMQEAEVYLPVISHKYTMDLSRTRSYFLHRYPLDVVVIMRHPDGSPAAGVPVQINVSSQDGWKGTTTTINTNQEGAVSPVFNVVSATQITIQVSADDMEQTKVIQPASSPSNSYLYISLEHKMYSVGELMTVHYNTIQGPNNGFIYYMVLSRGSLIKKHSVQMGTSLKVGLEITSDMVPSFRLIGYFYDQHGNIIADSVWVDVRDECEIKVQVTHKGQYKPRQPAKIDIDLHGQRAKVALLAVDKAVYALKADNKLTAKQVFSSMQSYDLGCSYTGGADPASVLTDAGLSFVTHSQFKYNFGCGSQSTRQRRAVDLHRDVLTRANITDKKSKECCVHGLSTLPMKLTCEERARRVSLVEADSLCEQAFLACCLKGELLRQKMMQEDARGQLGRTATIEDIEQYFLENTGQNIRRVFPPSFDFKEIDVNGKGSHVIALPDSITTWELQVVTLSAFSGFCVAKPSEIRVFQDVFVSLRLPYSVKKYEQITISPVIYNYGYETLQLAVNMEQNEGLCSPGSATSVSFVNITIQPQSSQFLFFSAVPMITGSIPIKIRLYDIENERGLDAIEKTLNVLAEGMEQREEQTKLIKFDVTERSSQTIIIDGSLPSDSVPDSSANIFVSLEGEGFDSSHAKHLLSPENVGRMIRLPTGCSEQTMSTLAPTLSAIRYLDKSDQWIGLDPSARDKAMKYVEHGQSWILNYKNKATGHYPPFASEQPSYWLTGLVVKTLSFIAQRQTKTFGQQGMQVRSVPLEEIRHSVRFLRSVQQNGGSFIDPHPVHLRGVLRGTEHEAFITAFVTLALQYSLPFLDDVGRNNTKASISRSTSYLLSRFEELSHPYAVALTVYCLAVCLPSETDHVSLWAKLEALAVEGENGCYMWTTNPSPENKAYADAITIETTAYALLAALVLKKSDWAEKAACWLQTQENSYGGFRSTQETAMAMEALAEYALQRPSPPEASLKAVFTSPGRSDTIKLELAENGDKVETDLKRLAGERIHIELTGKGTTKLKVVKAYNLLEPKDECKEVSISVTVKGKVEYTAKVIENYDEYEDYDTEEKKTEFMPQTPIEWFDVRTRINNNLNSEETLSYTVCVKVNGNLTGMAIADITLLSGFEAVTEDLDILKNILGKYISHYEVSHGRVLIYFNTLFFPEECIVFKAIQTVPVGLLQPAPAVFYDYYEPSIKCTVFYSAPQRSKLISKICSGDVCQCAERPCHTIQNTFKSERTRRNKRLKHACFSPTVDYAFMVEVLQVSMKGNFELYRMNITEVLKSYGDKEVAENSVRVFAKRRHCKGQLDVGQQYLIMGKDGSTTDSDQKMQYLLESNTWVERKPSAEECRKSANRAACQEFRSFKQGYKIDGCRH